MQCTNTHIRKEGNQTHTFAVQRTFNMYHNFVKDGQERPSKIFNNSDVVCKLYKTTDVRNWRLHWVGKAGQAAYTP